MTKVGEIQVETGYGPIDVPIYDYLDTTYSTADLERFITVEVADDVQSFIPVAKTPSEATYPFLRVQSETYGICAVHKYDFKLAWRETWEGPDPGWGDFTRVSGSEALEGRYSGYLKTTTGTRFTDNLYGNSITQPSKVGITANVNHVSNFNISGFGWERENSSGDIISGTSQVIITNDHYQYDIDNDSGYEKLLEHDDGLTRTIIWDYDWSNEEVEVGFNTSGGFETDSVLTYGPYPIEYPSYDIFTGFVFDENPYEDNASTVYLDDAFIME